MEQQTKVTRPNGVAGSAQAAEVQAKTETPVETDLDAATVHKAQLHTSLVPLHADDQEVPTSTSGSPQLEQLPFDLSSRERAMIRRLARYLLIGGICVWLGSLIWAARDSLSPFVVGLVLAYVMTPLVNRLNRRLPRWAAILSVYAVTLLLVVGLAAYVIPPLVTEVGALIASTPSFDELQTQGEGFLASYRAYMPTALQVPIEQAIARALLTLRTNLTSYFSDLSTWLLTSALQVVDTLVFLIGFLIVPVWLFYVLNDDKAALQAVDRLIPAALRDDVWALARIIDKVFSNYLRGQLLLGLIVGLMVGLGLGVLQLFGFEVNYILVLAVFAGFTELIPYVGPIIGAIPAILLGLYDGPSTALAVLVLFLLIQQVENQFLVPRVVGESVNISPALMFVLLVVATHSYGLAGAILAAPVAAAVRDVVAYLNMRLSDPIAR